jgi:hypothetical protein
MLGSKPCASRSKAGPNASSSPVRFQRSSKRCVSPPPKPAHPETPRWPCSNSRGSATQGHPPRTTSRWRCCWVCHPNRCHPCGSNGATSKGHRKGGCWPAVPKCPRTLRPKSATTSTPRTLRRQNASLATAISKPPISTASSPWSCLLATPPTRPMPMRATHSSHTARAWPCPLHPDRFTSATPLMMSPPTTTGYTTRAASPSLTTIGETSISTPSRYANGATIKTVRPMPLAAVFADPMATIMKPKAGSTSVAWLVPSASGDTARIALAS